jgi:general secretion pathway protein G
MRLCRRSTSGFTLLEMVIVLTILVILAAVGVVAYQKIQLKAKETLLKHNLQTIRRQIDQFAADKERLPQSLEELVSEGYLKEMPIDPITGQADWEVEIGEDTVSREGGQGIVDVHSRAPGVGTDGKPYSEY